MGIRFSIWDLFVLTSLVALMLGLPPEVVQAIVVSSLYVCFFSGTGLAMSMFTSGKRKERAAIGERFFIRLLARLLMYSTVLILVGATAIAVRSLGSR